MCSSTQCPPGAPCSAYTVSAKGRAASFRCNSHPCPGGDIAPTVSANLWYSHHSLLVVLPGVFPRFVRDRAKAETLSLGAKQENHMLGLPSVVCDSN